MKSFESVEELLNEWKAAKGKAIVDNYPKVVEEYENKIFGAKAALIIIDKPSNYVNATDALQCPECQQNGESGMNFCANCGRQLWHR